MSTPAAPIPPDPVSERAAALRARTLRYRALENRYRSEDALDRGDLESFQGYRHSARLENDLADAIEAEEEA